MSGLVTCSIVHDNSTIIKDLTGELMIKNTHKVSCFLYILKTTFISNGKKQPGNTDSFNSRDNTQFKNKTIFIQV